MIRIFQGEHRFLSNYYSPCSVTYKGLTYYNSEAAYQAQKCRYPERKKLFTDLTPDEAKGLGKRVALVYGWDGSKADIMREIVRAKFEQHPELAKKLIDTGTQELVEGNTWHDNFFGNCECPACRHIEGKNWLGRILMDERFRLRKEAEDDRQKMGE